MNILELKACLSLVLGLVNLIVGVSQAGLLDVQGTLMANICTKLKYSPKTIGGII